MMDKQKSRLSGRADVPGSIRFIVFLAQAVGLAVYSAVAISVTSTRLLVLFAISCCNLGMAAGTLLERRRVRVLAHAAMRNGAVEESSTDPTGDHPVGGSDLPIAAVRASRRQGPPAES